LKEYIHIGIAVDTEFGLIVPVIRDVDKKDLVQLAKELESLATKARERKVSGEELKGGTFTISNQGGIAARTSLRLSTNRKLPFLVSVARRRNPWCAMEN